MPPRLKPLLSLAVFLPALAEICLLRLVAHGAFGKDVLQLGVHATDIYLPVAIGLGALFLMGQRTDPLAIGPQPKAIALNLGLLLVAILTGIKFHAVQDNLGPDWASAALLGFGLAAFLTSFFVLLPWRAILVKARQEQTRVLCFVLGVQLLVAYPIVLEKFWKSMAMATGNTSYHILRTAGIWVQKPLVQNSLRLWNPNFSAYMNMGCSGLEGIFFFLSGFILVSAYEGKPIHLLRTAKLVFFGCLLMFALNVFRITSVFAGGVIAETYYTNKGGREFFEWFFHANVGWALYLAAMYWFFTRWVMEPQTR